MSTIKKGRILRDTASGDGLVFVDGQQFPFKLEGQWRSEFAPRVNMTVDAEFDDQGQLVALRSASGAAAITSEQAAQVLGAAQESARKMASEFQQKGLPVIAEYAAKIGYPTLGALGAVILGWFFMPVVSINMGMVGRNSATFYQGLKLLNAEGIESLAALSGGGSAGFYGFLCFASLLAVLLPQVWRDRRASLGMAAPLALMLLVTVIAWFKIRSMMPEVPAEYAQMAQQMADQASAEMRKAVSIGFGLWLAVPGALYLAWQGWQKHRQT